MHNKYNTKSNRSSNTPLLTQVRAMARSARTIGVLKDSRGSEAAQSFKHVVNSAGNHCQAINTMARTDTVCVASQVAEQQRMLQRAFDNSNETIDITASVADFELSLVLAEQAFADARACLQPGSTRLQRLQAASSRVQQLQRALQMQIELEIANQGCSNSAACSEESSSSEVDGIGMVTIDLLSSSDTIDVVVQIDATSCSCTDSCAADNSSSLIAVQRETGPLQASQSSSWRVVGSPAEERHKAAAGSSSSSLSIRRSSSSGGSLKSVFMAASAVSFTALAGTWPAYLRSPRHHCCARSADSLGWDALFHATAASTLLLLL
jgi:hypothetical protein